MDLKEQYNFYKENRDQFTADDKRTILLKLRVEMLKSILED
jgi:hypothetical protein